MNRVSNILKDFQDKSEFLINNITDVITEVDLDGTFTYVSPQVYDMFGYKPEDIIGKKFLSFIHPDDLPTITGAFSEIIKSNEIFSLEYRVRHKKGHYVPISARGSLVKVKDKLKLIGILRDITEKKLTEQKLIESEEKFRTITEQSLLGILILQDNTIKYANEPLSKILGYSIQEMMKMSINELFKIVHPDDRAIVMERLNKKQSEGLIDSHSYIIRMLKKTEELRLLEVYYKIIQYQGMNAILASIIDVTDNKESIQKLKESEKFVKSILNTVPSHIYIYDWEKSQNIYSAPHAEAMLGYTPEELSNLGDKALPTLLHPDDEGKFKQTVEKLLIAADNEIIEGEYRFKHKNGNWVHVFDRMMVFKRNNDGQVLQVLGSAIDITERKKFEEKLKKSEENYQLLFNKSPVYIYVTDIEGIILDANELLLKRVGFSREEYCGLNSLDFFVGNNQDDLNEAISLIRDGKEAKGFEFKVKTVSGEIFEYEIDCVPLKEEGQVTKVLNIAHDITSRKQAEKKLIKSEERLKFLVSSSPTIIYTSKTSGDYGASFISDNVREEMGYLPEDFLKNSEFWISNIHPDDTKQVLIELQKLQEKGHVIYDYRFKYNDGTYHWMRDEAKLIKDENGNPLETIGSIVDISERKEVEQKLQESEKKYYELFENSPSSILLIDFNSIIVDCNHATEAVTGYYKKDLLGNTFTTFDFLDGDTIKKVMDTFNLLVRGNIIHRLEIPAKKKDGTPIWIMTRGSLVTIEEKNLIQIIFHDITERKKVDQELIEISRLKSELLERTSHELKTPIIAIKGFTDLLLDLHKEKFDTETITTLEEIKQGTERLESIINKLLEISYLESKQVQLNPTKEDLMFLIKFSVKNLRGLAKTRNHFIYLNIPDRLNIIIEKEKIYDVISHLIINAIKYTPPYGEIKIESKIINNFIIISVEDNGIGLSDDDQKKIFKRFGKIERYGQGWDIGIEGTGMGLYTAKKIIELHGGKIWAESNGINKGSKFYFSLPIIEE